MTPFICKIYLQSSLLSPLSMPAFPICALTALASLVPFESIVTLHLAAYSFSISLFLETEIFLHSNRKASSSSFKPLSNLLASFHYFDSCANLSLINPSFISMKLIFAYCAIILALFLSLSYSSLSITKF